MSELTSAAEPMILVNLERCVGCWSCAMSCKIGNGLDDDTWWIKVRTLGSGEGIDRPLGTYPNLSMTWLPVWTQKCVLCAGRTARGELPYCVYSCPVEALSYGSDEKGSPLTDEIAELKEQGYSVFKLPAWEESKAAITYAHKH
jgi:Fe-S-cluster-containing dehydrogenase component